MITMVFESTDDNECGYDASQSATSIHHSGFTAPSPCFLDLPAIDLDRHSFVASRLMPSQSINHGSRQIPSL